MQSFIMRYREPGLFFTNRLMYFIYSLIPLKFGYIFFKALPRSSSVMFTKKHDKVIN
jgi:hypothetical protein